MIIKPKGTYDLFGNESNKVLYLQILWTNIMDSYNFNMIRTPLFESSELFHRSVGETTDIVTKETYDFMDRGDRSLTLRPEGTAGAARCFIENKMYGDILPKKLWYYGPMYRYERPQSGRYREHYQFGCEVYGSDDPMTDAEVISIPVTFLTILGLKGIKVNINTLGDKVSRDNYKKTLTDYLKPHINELCEDCKERFEKNPLRILDCKVDKDNDILKKIPKTIDYLNEESKEYFDKVLKYLDALEIKYVVNPKTIRGLDYYTHTVFEIEADIKDFGAQNVLCGGGRYNNLIENLQGPKTPAVGFGMGSERLLLALEKEGIDIGSRLGLDCYVIPLSDNEKEFALSLCNSLRIMGFKTDIDTMNRSVKSNFKQAERLNSIFTIVIGEDEIKGNYVTVKNMLKQAEEKVDNSMIVDYLITKFNEMEETCNCGCDEDCDCGCNNDKECTCHNEEK